MRARAVGKISSYITNVFVIHKRIYLVFAKKYLLSANCNQVLFDDIRKMLSCVKIFLAKN